MGSIEISGKSGSALGAAAAAGKKELAVADLPAGLSDQQIDLLRLLFNDGALGESADKAGVDRSTLFRCRRALSRLRRRFPSQLASPIHRRQQVQQPADA